VLKHVKEIGIMISADSTFIAFFTYQEAEYLEREIELGTTRVRVSRKKFIGQDRNAIDT